jgi:DNA polymerase-3 subunit delta'
MLIGNQDIKNFFRRDQASDFLAGSYIFLGDSQIGKFAFAKELSESFEPNNKSILSDTLIIKPDSQIGIDQVRQIKNFLWQTPSISSYRTVIIDNAEQMTPEAQNAFLKIVEEPPRKALIILISSYPEILVPTLLSRFKKIHFKKIPQEHIRQWLINEFKIKPSAAETLAKKSMGRPGLAYSLLYDKNTIELENRVESFIKGDIFQKNKIINEIIKDEESLNKFIEFLIAELRNKILKKDHKTFKEILKRLAYLRRFNLNKKLQLEIIANQIEL